MAGFGGLLFGFDTGYINGVLAMDYQQETVGGMSEKLNHNPRWFHLPAKEKLLVVGMLSIGTAMGALAGSDLADYLGRRVTLIIGTSLFLAGVADQLASEHLNSLTRGRFETGMAVGIVTVVIVVYLTEISPAHLRGHVIVMFQFSITLGLLLASCVTMTTRKLWSPAAYRIPIGLQFIWGVGLMVGLYVLPESPRWYVKVGRVNRAKIAVMRLRRVPMPGGNPKEWETDPGVEAEMKEIEEGRQHYSGDGNVTHEEAEQNFTVSRYCRSWKLCLEGPWSLTSCNAKRTLFGAALMMFQQLTGVNFVFYFGATLFKQQGFSNPFVLAAGLGAVNVVSTLVSFVIVPAARRRMLLMGGAAAMGLCQLTVGLLERPHQVPSWFMATTMTAIGLYIFSYATTWGPGAWSLLGEIFPMHIRARAIGISAATNWLFNSVVCFITPLMVDQAHGNLGMWVFLIWSGSSVAAFVFVFYFVPETSGRTLEEVAFNLDFGARKIKHRHMESGTWAVEARAWNSVCESMSNENRRKSSGSGGLGSEEFVKKQGASVDSGMSGATAVSSADGPPPYRRSPQEQEKKLEDKNGHRGVPTVQVDFNMDSFSRPSSTAPQDTDDVESISPKTCRGRD
ncbi:general substrate transporter [Cladorrhinum sp. PSN259]|nr:general substrate transporter [Cladorrhinum sp. PSN259]